MYDHRGRCYPANVIAVPTEDKNVDDLRLVIPGFNVCPMISTKLDTRERVGWGFGGVMGKSTGTGLGGE